MKMEWEEEVKILEKLSRFRAKLWDLRIIGKTETDSYGNVSHRLDESFFAISRSGVGGLRKLSPDDFIVARYRQGEFHPPSVFRGILTEDQKPSRDTKIHSALYSGSEKVNVVAHFHHPLIWGMFLDKFPTTSVDKPPGSVELAEEIFDLCQKLDLQKDWIIILGSHEDGILTFGENIESLEEKIIALVKEYPLQEKKKYRK
jgi:ribulose-5-phosphate 4-epimerase/fuculose-1-phosphate aldolase